MNCQVARVQITDSLAAGSMKLTKDLAGHVQSCAGCGTFYAQQAELFRAMDSGLGTMANEPIPASLLPRVRARMEVAHAVSSWFYRLVPVAGILVVACLIAFPLVHRSVRTGGVQVAVVPRRSGSDIGPRQPIADQSGSLMVPHAPRKQIARDTSRTSVARRSIRPTEVAVIVDPEESKGLFELAAAVRQRPQWAQAMLHPVELPPIQMKPIEPIEIADLEVQPLSEGSQ